MVDVLLIALDVDNVKPAWLRDLLNEIELLATLGQCGKYQKKRMRCSVRDQRPQGGNADIFCVDQA